MNRRLFCIFFAAVIMVGLSKCDECFAQVGKYVLRQVPKALPKMIPKKAPSPLPKRASPRTRSQSEGNFFESQARREVRKHRDEINETFSDSSWWWRSDGVSRTSSLWWISYESEYEPPAPTYTPYYHYP